MFSDKYIEKVMATHSHLCVGLDPILDKYPTYLLQEATEKYGKTLKGAAYAILTFNKMVIDLIDGNDLAKHLKKLGLGVDVEIVEKVIINEEWFKNI